MGPGDVEVFPLAERDEAISWAASDSGTRVSTDSRVYAAPTVAARRPRWTRMIMLITATHTGNRSATARTVATESINTITNA
jgi:hypothetical protein